MRWFIQYLLCIILCAQNNKFQYILQEYMLCPCRSAHLHFIISKLCVLCILWEIYYQFQFCSNSAFTSISNIDLHHLKQNFAHNSRKIQNTRFFVLFLTRFLCVRFISEFCVFYGYNIKLQVYCNVATQIISLN